MGDITKDFYTYCLDLFDQWVLKYPVLLERYASYDTELYNRIMLNYPNGGSKAEGFGIVLDMIHGYLQLFGDRYKDRTYLDIAWTLICPMYPDCDKVHLFSTVFTSVREMETFMLRYRYDVGDYQDDHGLRREPPGYDIFQINDRYVGLVRATISPATKLTPAVMEQDNPFKERIRNAPFKRNPTLVEGLLLVVDQSNKTLMSRAFIILDKVKLGRELSPDLGPSENPNPVLDAIRIAGYSPENMFNTLQQRNDFAYKFIQEFYPKDKIGPLHYSLGTSLTGDIRAKNDWTTDLSTAMQVQFGNGLHTAKDVAYFIISYIKSPSDISVPIRGIYTPPTPQPTFSPWADAPTPEVLPGRDPERMATGFPDEPAKTPATNPALIVIVVLAALAVIGVIAFQFWKVR